MESSPLTTQRDYVNFVVDGMYYSMLLQDIEKFPQSYFYAATKKEWSPDQDAPIHIARDGKLFRYIVDFHNHGKLCVSNTKVAFDMVKNIQTEADFFNLPALVRACETYVLDCIGGEMKGNYVACVCSADDPEDLINVVGEIWAPFCIRGVRTLRDQTPILKSSTLHSLKLNELCRAAVPAPFGKGSESVIDPAVRDALEIAADQLHPDLWKSFETDNYPLEGLSPRMKIEMRPYKLVIYKEGGHFSEHRDSVRGENHIGTLVHILNSKFTGGELVVRQNDQEVSISKPGEWIAMYGDALHRINPVTSGTRVALIFDLYQTGTYSEKEFLDEYSSVGLIANNGFEHGISDRTRDKVFAALEEELKCFDDVVISLTHLYPICQADLSYLKGGDALLYELLHAREDEYDLSIVPVKIHEQGVETLESDAEEEDKMECSLALDAVLVDLPGELSGQYGTIPKRHTLLTIPVHCKSNHVLFHNEYVEYVGNQPQQEETMYLVTGLKITKRNAVVETSSSSNVAEDVPSVYTDDAPISAGRKHTASGDVVEKPTKKVA